MASVAAAKVSASEEPVSPSRSSVPGLCLDAALRYGKADALNHKVGGEWIHFSAEIFVQRVHRVALGLASLGINSYFIDSLRRVAMQVENGHA